MTRQDAYDAGYDPTPEEVWQDARMEPSRSYRGPRGRSRLRTSRATEWQDTSAVALGEYDPWASAIEARWSA